MEFHQLESFIAVAEEGGVTPAARRLFSTPSAVSAHIRALERELCVSLFVRTARGMEITPAGRDLVPTAEETLRVADTLRHRAARMQDRLDGRVALGINATPEFLRVATITEGLSSRFPDLELAIITVDSGDVADRLRDGVVDVAYRFGGQVGEGLSAEPLPNAELVLAAPASWDPPRVVDWSELESRPWVVAGRACPFQQIVDRKFHELGVPLRRAVESGDESTRLDLVRSGVGLSLLERTEAERAARRGEITVWESGPIECELAVVSLRSRRGNPRIEALVGEVLDAWR